MTDFFASNYTGAKFALFSELHIKTLLIILVINFLLFIILKWRKSLKLNTYFRYGLASILIVGEVALIVWHIATNQFSLAQSLPIHLCRISALLAAIVLVTKSKKLYQILYFIGMGAAIPALLSPDIAQFNFPHFAFFKFFINHSGIVTAILYMTIIEGYSPNFKSIMIAMGALNLYLPVILVINWLTGGNYLYLMHKPTNASFMDYLGSWPWYILSLEVIAIILFLVYYVPFIISQYLTKFDLNSDLFNVKQKKEG